MLPQPSSSVYGTRTYTAATFKIFYKTENPFSFQLQYNIFSEKIQVDAPKSRLFFKYQHPFMEMLSRKLNLQKMHYQKKY